MSKYLEKIIIFLLLVVVTLGYYIFDLSMEIILYAGIWANLYLIIKSRKFKPLALMFFFWLTFIINLIPYYSYGEDISGGYFQLDIPAYYDKTTFSQVFFLLSMALFMPTIKNPIYLKDRIPYKKELFSFWFTMAFMFIIFLFGAKGQSVLDIKGGYGTTKVEGLGDTAIHEYFVILIAPALIFSGRNKTLRFCLYILTALYCLKTLSLGGRNLLIQVAMLLFVLFDNPKIKYRYIIPLGIVPVYLFLLFGIVRSSPILLFSKSIGEILFLPFTRPSIEMLITQNDVFYSSVRFYAFIEEGIISLPERISITFFNILAIVTPFRYLPPSTNIAAYRTDIYNCGGGSLISAYYYLFLGIPGLVLIAGYISWIIKKATIVTNKYFLLYIMMFLSTFVRWFAYNPIVIFKLCMYGALYVVVLEIAKSIIKLRPAKNSQTITGKINITT